MRTQSGTGRRLFLAFAVLVSTFALASWLTLSQVREIRAGLVQMKQYEEGVRRSLELASAVRDQYAHQAHTIILGNESHLPLYTAAERHVGVLTEAVRAHATARDEQIWVDDIEAASARLDQVFRQRIVPAVLKGSVADVREEHNRAQLLVSLIQDRSDKLVDRFETQIGDFRARVDELQALAFRRTLFFAVGAPLLAVLVGAYVLRSVAGPVARLREGAARLAGGDLDTRIEIDTPDEFGALARQFNAMTRALKEHQAQLVQHEKLAGIGRLAAGVAHEINNPLGVILGYARLLRKKAEGTAAEDLQVIEDETLRAKQIVDGLLDLSRPLQILPEPVDLRALCAEAVERLRAARVLDGVEVELTGSARTRGHPQKLRQVVLNLIKNAAEAAGPGGRVAVALAEGADAARVAVSDSGPGLQGDALARVFEPFFTTKDGGTGLGLAVSKGIVQAHGGEIEAGQAEGGGARFEVRLPPG
ncbi:MAG: ATP-binding protein [Anaeromyxobacter sp.]